MKRRTYLQTLLGAGAITGIAFPQAPKSPAKGAAKGAAKHILLYCDMEVDLKKEQAMLDHFNKVFKPAAMKQPGYIDVKLMKLRSTLQGKADPRWNYRFALEYVSEELRQNWIHTPTHQQVWPPIENMFVTKDYVIQLFDITTD